MHVHLQRETKRHNHVIPNSNHFFAFQNTQNATNSHYSLMARFCLEKRMQENERHNLLLKTEGFSLKVLKNKKCNSQEKVSTFNSPLLFLPNCAMHRED